VLRRSGRERVNDFDRIAPNAPRLGQGVWFIAVIDQPTKGDDICHDSDRRSHHIGSDPKETINHGFLPRLGNFSAAALFVPERS